jgi:predicted DNA-binding transcriptional regulator AlpA
VEELATRGLTFDEIAVCLGISRATLFRKKQQLKDFCAALQRGRAKGILLAANAIYEVIHDGKLRAIISFLKKHGFREKPNPDRCPDDGLSYLAGELERQRQLRSYMTPAEKRWLRDLDRSLTERIRAQGHSGKGDPGEGEVDSENRHKPGANSQPQSRRTGRPRWSSPDLKEVEELAERGLTRGQLAAYLGIDRTTLYRKMRDCPEFAAAVRTGEARAVAFVAGKLLEHIERGNLTATKFYLSAKCGWVEDAETYEHHHSPRCVPVRIREERNKEGELAARLMTEAERMVHLELYERAERRTAAGAPPGRGRPAVDTGLADEMDVSELFKWAKMGRVFFYNRDKMTLIEYGDPPNHDEPLDSGEP